MHVGVLVRGHQRSAVEVDAAGALANQPRRTELGLVRTDADDPAVAHRHGGYAGSGEVHP